MPEVNPVEQLLREANQLHGVWAEMADKVGYAVAVWAQRQMLEAVHQPDVEYPDNDRWCRIGVPEEEALFEEIAQNGCCGVAEWEATDPEGQVWRFGFNYGH